jgi:hypothetical protein
MNLENQLPCKPDDHLSGTRQVKQRIDQINEGGTFLSCRQQFTMAWSGTWDGWVRFTTISRVTRGWSEVVLFYAAAWYVGHTMVCV